MKKIKFLSIFLIFFSSTALSDVNYTLIIMSGEILLDKQVYFKDKNKCTFFANRMNNHPPIPNKEGKMEKMKAYCKSVKTSITILKFKPEQSSYTQQNKI